MPTLYQYMLKGDTDKKYILAENLPQAIATIEVMASNEWPGKKAIIYFIELVTDAVHLPNEVLQIERGAIIEKLRLDIQADMEDKYRKRELELRGEIHRLNRELGVCKAANKPK